MNHASHRSAPTLTTNSTLLDASSSWSTVMGSMLSNSSCRTATTTPAACALVSGNNSATVKIYNYKLLDFTDYPATYTCEEICISLCRSLNILPTTRLLFGLRVYDSEQEWVVPKKTLRSDVRYCFRMRFKVPALDEQLYTLDMYAYDYLYRQMRVDRVFECIPEIRYPEKKDSVVGLGVLDMCIDLLENRGTVEYIESNYERYLPRKIVKAHWVFVKRKICNNFRQCRSKSYGLAHVKLIYVKEMHNLAPNYLLERFTAVVDYIPGEEELSTPSDTAQYYYLKLDLYDTQEPGMKIARIASENKLKWILVAKMENIFALYTDSGNTVRLEITGFLNAYRIQFDSTAEMESFITYLSGYIRLTSKWMFDLSMAYTTPSLQELKELHCHGPIGGSFAFAKICEKRNECGTYLIRQCEKEYDTYYIDINTKSMFHPKKCKTETFKIKRNNSKWVLYYNDNLNTFDSLREVEQFIPTDAEHKYRLPPSEDDNPPLLLICLPKNLLSKKTEHKMSDAELHRKRVQIFDPKNDLQWYKNSERECASGKMRKFKADWILQGGYGEVCVTLKVLKSDGDFTEFMKLTNTWSQIYSPQFIKLYGITLQMPYTMIMEYEAEALNDFLQQHKDKVSKKCLLDIVLGLVRGIVYLREYGIMHGFIRCCNLYVTNFNEGSNQLEAKIGDPGYPRPYRAEDLPWIPFEYHRNLRGAKQDRTTDLWAFATTIWEIYAFGEPIQHYTAEMLQRNYNKYGGILPQRDIPEEMYKTMLDGWNMNEPDKRFNHHEIFDRINSTKDDLCSSYQPVRRDVVSEHSDSSSMQSETLNTGDDTFDNDHSLAMVSTSTTGDIVPLLRNEHNFIGHHEQHPISYFENTRQVLQIPDGKVIFKKKNKIGEGHYGTVYYGEIHYENNKREKVAIKTLKSFKLSQLNDDFMREIKIMENLDHPNVVKIKAWIEDPLSIIMEFVQSGSLIVYLSSGKPNLTNKRLLRFALDIAKGMAYLCSKNIIHRDLAARNILVDLDRAKISDFGLAQMANSNGYYVGQSNREIPIKWYAPEVIQTSKYSLNSDVWSYGVTLFEMFSRGELPNLDPDNEITQLEFLKRLERGDRLRKPPMCPDNVYDKLMVPCWFANPKMRPKFQTLINEIQSIINENGEAT